MIYRLYSADGQARSPVGETDMPSNFAALDWAQSWPASRPKAEASVIPSQARTAASAQLLLELLAGSGMPSARTQSKHEPILAEPKIARLA